MPPEYLEQPDQQVQQVCWVQAVRQDRPVPRVPLVAPELRVLRAVLELPVVLDPLERRDPLVHAVSLVAPVQPVPPAFRVPLVPPV